MNIYTCTFPILVLPFKQHLEVKQPLLDAIDTTDTVDLKEPFSAISRSNYRNCSLQDQYWQLVSGPIQQQVSEAVSSYGYMAEITQQWFQQYQRHDTHPWHTHPGSDLSIVYYVELPDHAATEFLDLVTKKITSFPVHEGDLLIFPSVMTHRSPVNRTTNRKTVIAMNARAANATTEMRY